MISIRLWLLSFLCLLTLRSGICSQVNRIISLSPALTEIICELGGKSQLVGITTACDYPSEIKSLPKVGHFLNPSIERIADLKPDLVLAFGNPDSPQHHVLKSLDISVKTLPTPKSILEIFDYILEIGVAINKREEAIAFVHSLRSKIMNTIHPNKTEVAHNVLLLIAYPPMMVAGRDTFINDIIEAAHGINVIRQVSNQYPILDLEQALLLKPDIVLCCFPISKSNLTRLEMLFKAPILHLNDSDIILRPGPRIVQGIIELREQFKSVMKCGRVEHAK